MAGLKLKNIFKTYENGRAALTDFDLEVANGEFVVLSGPPGCGKSTVLKLIAGLEEVSSGALLINDSPASGGAEERDIAMVFQHFELLPKLSVRENLAYGLKLRGQAASEIDARIAEAVAVLRLETILNEKPKSLTEEQRRRVALGRVIVRRPAVFLLDEPLADLTGKARVELWSEIIKLHRRVGTTFIYATSNQAEAMSLGARLIVMNNGTVAQADVPQSVYDNPANLFTASFLGEPQMNFFKALLTREDGKMYASFGKNKILIPVARARRLFDEAYIGKEVMLGVRPEDLHDEEVFVSSSPGTVIDAFVDTVERLGNETILYLKIDGKPDYVVARVNPRNKSLVGDAVRLALDGNRLHFFDSESGFSIAGIPQSNRIFAELICKEGNASVRFGDTMIVLNTALTRQLSQVKEGSTDVRFEIDPDSLTEKKAFDAAQLRRLQNGDPLDEDEYFEVKGVLEFTEKHPLFTAAFVLVAGKRGAIVVKLPPETVLGGGDPICLLGKLSKIRLYEIETGNRLFASTPS